MVGLSWISMVTGAWRPRLAGAATLIGLTLGLALHPGAVRAANCDRPASDEETVQCLGADLRRTDAEINRVYNEVRGKLDDAGKLALRNEQRAWLKRRDETCGLDNKESDREKWFQAILTNRAKTVCVVRFTNERSAQLAAEQAGQAPAPDAAASGDLYEIWARPPVSTGKWYVEATIDMGAVAKRAETALFFGAENREASFGPLIQLRHDRAGEPKHVLGLAVDLDTGWLYMRVDGAWKGAAPGQTGGMQIPARLPTVMGLTSSVTMAALVKDGLISVNFGERPFVYAVPDGYKPLK
ncbi:lysozyme inhibitor LprI family protein [Nitrospirillum sp. BR 11164]|uniref:lysozyme inhibitor LprI family protein n=1 Tax=Nitrospirillum sp. BR 11164 TaxID=3104324 RepID=UPI002AFEC1B1|nr:lysozyme inhibitor LprI family protein [Nitrospirillum sp. BR 11164]MEA1651446.1 lysozyme inhibitor LprI family protein [Nitrospirillum sp. BR 11164]